MARFTVEVVLYLRSGGVKVLQSVSNLVTASAMSFHRFPNKTAGSSAGEGVAPVWEPPSVFELAALALLAFVIVLRTSLSKLMTSSKSVAMWTAVASWYMRKRTPVKVSSVKIKGSMKFL